MKEQLEKSEAERRYLQDVILKNTGLIKEQINTELAQDQNDAAEDFRAIPRGVTLSSIRNQAEQVMRRRANSHDSVPATIEDLTEAERVFQESLRSNLDANV